MTFDPTLQLLIMREWLVVLVGNSHYQHMLSLHTYSYCQWVAAIS